jgi:hypothetical protein
MFSASLLIGSNFGAELKRVRVNYSGESRQSNRTGEAK